MTYMIASDNDLTRSIISDLFDVNDSVVTVYTKTIELFAFFNRIDDTRLLTPFPVT